MSAARGALVRQFKRPEGALGWLAGRVMAARPSNRRRNEWTLDLLDLAPDARIFELGCGPGYALALAAKRAPQGFLTGVDHSPVMTMMARRRLANAVRKGRANILVGDDRQLKSFDGELDAIWSANVIQFLDEPDRYFTFAADALRQGGRIATTYMPRASKDPAAAAARIETLCRDAMVKAGFADMTTHRMDLGAADAICVTGVKPKAVST